MPRHRHQRKISRFSILNIIEGTAYRISSLGSKYAGYILVLVLAICVLLLVAGYQAFQSSQRAGFPSEFRSNTSDDPTIEITVSIKEMYIDSFGNEVLSLVVQLNGYSSNLTEANNQKYCIESIYMADNSATRYQKINPNIAVITLTGMPDKLLELQGICVYQQPGYSVPVGHPNTDEDSDLVKERLSPVLISNSLYSIDLTRYPYDVRENILLFWVNIRTEDGNLIVVAPNVSFSSNPLGREIDVTFNKNPSNLPEGVNAATETYITLRRLASIRFLTAVLLSSIAVFIISIIFVKDNSIASELSLGILLGLWGIQDILIPTNISGATFIRSAIIYLYFLLTLAAIVRFFAVPLYKRLKEQAHGVNTRPPST